jgi:hypothetical protein
MGSKPLAINIQNVSQDPDQFLKAILDGLNYDGYRFCSFGTDGCLGSYCISKSQTVLFPGTSKQLSLHLNFNCVPGGYTTKVNAPYKAKFNLAIKHFHMTARPKSGQMLINSAGPSILTAEESIHINRNTHRLGAGGKHCPPGSDTGHEHNQSPQYPQTA